MERTEIYISIDTEFTGPYPSGNTPEGERGSGASMVAIGAVACGIMIGNNFTAMDIDHASNRFYSVLKPDGLWTRQSSLKVIAQGGVIYDDLVKNGPEPYGVMRAFASWVDNITFGGVHQPIAVIYPVSDFSWIYRYLEKYVGRDNPFGYSRYIDIKSMYFGYSGKPLYNCIKQNMPLRFTSGRPHTHNALDDATAQADMFIKIMQNKH